MSDNNQSLEDRVYEYIKRHIGTTFAELSRAFPEDFNSDYEFGLVDKGIILWKGLTSEMCDIINRLFKTQRIMYDSSPQTFMMYVMDGAFLRMPLYNRRIRKRPVWFPVAIYTIDYYQKVLLPSKSKKDRKLAQAWLDTHKPLEPKEMKKNE